MIDDKDLAKAFAIADRLQNGEIISMDRIAIEKRDFFIECLKQYICSNKASDFNSDYTKFRKNELPKFI